MKMSDDVDDFLAHYGVLGMKWGHHKSPATMESVGGNTPPKPLSSRPIVRSVQTLHRAHKGTQQFTTGQKTVAGLNLLGAGVQAAAVAWGVAWLGTRAYGSVKVAHINKSQVDVGRKAAAALFSDKRGVGNLSVYALKQATNGAWG